MSDQGDADTRYLQRKEAAKEHARKLRRQAYERAKELTKAQRLERQNTPEAEARRLRLREQRRAAYQRAKDSYKARVEERKRLDKERADREAAEAQALRDEELLATLKRGDEIAPRPRLRLVRPDEAL